MKWVPFLKIDNIELRHLGYFLLNSAAWLQFLKRVSNCIMFYPDFYPCIGCWSLHSKIKIIWLRSLTVQSSSLSFVFGPLRFHGKFAKITRRGNGGGAIAGRGQCQSTCYFAYIINQANPNNVGPTLKVYK